MTFKRRRAGLLFASSVLGLALTAAGCGSSSDAPGVAAVAHVSTSATQTTPPSQPTVAQDYAASRCMRTHGVPNFPNPITVNGKKTFGFYFSSGIKDTPQFQAARKFCVRKYLNFYDRRTPAERAKSNAQAVKYTECMRSHGARDFPDPDGTGAINMPTPNYLDAPKVARAQQACKPLLTNDFVFVVPF